MSIMGDLAMARKGQLRFVTLNVPIETRYVLFHVILMCLCS